MESADGSCSQTPQACRASVHSAGAVDGKTSRRPAHENYSEYTIKGRRVRVGFFLEWVADRGITEPVEVTRTVLEAYQRYVFHYRKKNGQPLGFNAQHDRLVPLRVWFRWMARNHHILHNPASELELPRLAERLPKAVLSAAEVEQIMLQTDIHDPLGLRDRAILETVYSTGVRCLDLAQLKLWDVDLEADDGLRGERWGFATVPIHNGDA